MINTYSRTIYGCPKIIQIALTKTTKTNYLLFISFYLSFHFPFLLGVVIGLVIGDIGITIGITIGDTIGVVTGMTIGVIIKEFWMNIVLVLSIQYSL